jgi:hypothetical protein
MPRKQLFKDDKPLWNSIVEVFEYSRTTAEERAEIVRKWLAGDNDSYMEIATTRKLVPIAVLLGSLIDSEHPVFAPGGNMPTKTLWGFAALVLGVELERTASGTGGEEIAVSIAMNFLNTADRYVDKNCGQAVDKCEVIHRQDPPVPIPAHLSTGTVDK